MILKFENLYMGSHYQGRLIGQDDPDYDPDYDPDLPLWCHEEVKPSVMRHIAHRCVSKAGDTFTKVNFPAGIASSVLHGMCWAALRDDSVDGEEAQREVMASMLMGLSEEGAFRP